MPRASPKPPASCAPAALVAFPTETVYGLGADATNGEAVAAIFAAKGRPLFNPLIVHVADLEEARRHVELSPRAQALAEKFWPGALTLVLPRRKNSPLSLLVSAGLDTVALRAPSHPAAIALLKAAGRPVAGPSANRSGQVTATTAAHVADSLGGKVDFILDAGSATLGIESTVIGFDGDRPLLLRPGAIPREEIEDLIGPLGRAGQPDPVAGPAGQPLCAARRLRLNAGEIESGEVLLGFGDAPGAKLNLVAARRSARSRRQSVRHAARAGQERQPDRRLAHSRHRHRRSDQRPAAAGGRAAMSMP